jgi:superfamily I DNA/RNA helicase
VEAARRGESFKVAAFAGTGKTTSLTETARALVGRRVLYLVFNKAQQIAAEARFAELQARDPRLRVQARTAHAIALKLYGASRYHGRLAKHESDAVSAWNAYLRSIGVGDALTEDAKVLRRHAIDVVKQFLASDDFEIGSRHYTANEQQPDAVEAARSLWEQLDGSSDSDLPITHDVYLKAWQLTKPRLPWCDVVMYDEAQDATPAMLDVVRRQTQLQTIFVGDEHQQIYEFRGAVNALGSLDLPTYALTETWRFGEKIAEMANAILAAKGEKRRIRPAREQPDAVRLGVPGKSDLVLARTNAGLVEEALRLAEQDTKFFLRGSVDSRTGIAGNGYGEVVRKMLSAFDVWQGKGSTHPLFADFGSWSELKRTVDDRGADGLRTYVRLIEKYQRDVPYVAKRLREGCTAEPESADVVLSTIHRFKGEEASDVLLANDLRRFSYRDEATQRDVLDDAEANLAYVAVTRARETLWLGGAQRIINESLTHAKIVVPFAPHAAAPTPPRARVTPTPQPKASIALVNGCQYRHASLGIVTVVRQSGKHVVLRGRTEFRGLSESGLKPEA